MDDEPPRTPRTPRKVKAGMELKPESLCSLGGSKMYLRGHEL
jgi:hypothetical protein